VLDQTKVTEIIPIGKEGAKVVTSKGEFTCKRLIICAGPWTNHCLKPFGKCQALPLWIARGVGSE
jgi:glycine/D-amino acid oxidase-like deaminating enzyme